MSSKNILDNIVEYSFFELILDQMLRHNSCIVYGYGDIEFLLCAVAGGTKDASGVPWIFAAGMSWSW